MAERRLAAQRRPLPLILAAVEPPLADAWERFCGDVPFVTVHRGSILEVETDAVVSPANSFGFMDGGIDAVYLDHFGRNTERLSAAVTRRARSLQRQIRVQVAES